MEGNKYIVKDKEKEVLIVKGVSKNVNKWYVELFLNAIGIYKDGWQVDYLNYDERKKYKGIKTIEYNDNIAQMAMDLEVIKRDKEIEQRKKAIDEGKKKEMEKEREKEKWLRDFFWNAEQ